MSTAEVIERYLAELNVGQIRQINYQAVGRSACAKVFTALMHFAGLMQDSSSL